MKRVHMESRLGRRGRKWFPDSSRRALPDAAVVSVLMRALMMGAGRRAGR